MSAIEFTAQAGKTFSVQLYNASTGATIGSAITGITDSGVPTRYRADTGSNTGVVYVVATATNLRVAGYADLNNPTNGFSVLTDTPGGGNAGVEATLAEIKAKTDLITADTIQLAVPVATDGSIDEIVIGDDYLAVNGRQFQWDVDVPSGFVLDGSTKTFFGGKIDGRQAWLVEGTAALVSGKWRLAFDLPRTATEKLSPGTAEWSVEVRNATSEITKVRPGSNAAQLVEKCT